MRWGVDLNISEEKLREIVKRVLLEIANESNTLKSKIEKLKVYIFCSKKCDSEYLDFLEQIYKSDLFNIHLVVDDTLKNDLCKSHINKYVADENITYFSDEIAKDLSHAISIFPVVERDLVVKTALCISDTFCNKWISSAIEEGGKIIFLKSGLKKFTNKEPKAYINQIVSYYRKVLEYGIEIKSTSELIKLYKEKNTNEQTKVNFNTKLNFNTKDNTSLQEENKCRKKVITLENVEQYGANGTIIVNSDDIITDLAREKARTLNIEIKEFYGGDR